MEVNNRVDELCIGGRVVLKVGPLPECAQIVAQVRYTGRLYSREYDLILRLHRCCERALLVYGAWSNNSAADIDTLLDTAMVSCTFAKLLHCLANRGAKSSPLRVGHWRAQHTHNWYA